MKSSQFDKIFHKILTILLTVLRNKDKSKFVQTNNEPSEPSIFVILQAEVILSDVTNMH